MPFFGRIFRWTAHEVDVFRITVRISKNVKKSQDLFEAMYTIDEIGKYDITPWQPLPKK